ncbi:MAG: DPP IV N-terminal domain-containing protein [bacterium]
MFARLERLRLALAVAVVVAGPNAHAQLAFNSDSAVRAVFTARAVGGIRFGPARWSSGGDSYTTLERTDDGGTDIVEYEAATGHRRVRVASRQLQPAGASAPLDIDDYTWSNDGKRLLVFTNTRQVWRQNTRGDYWVLDVASGKLHKVGAGAKEATLMFAKFSPDDGRVAYVREGDIYVEPALGGKATRLTHDASRKVVNGMTDWVYEEEFDLRDAFRWSPDSKAIAFWQFDMTGIRDFLLINDTDSLYPFTMPVQYPKAGTTNSAVRLGVVLANGTGHVTWAKLEGDARQHYIPRAEWAGSTELVVQYMDRPQHHDWVNIVNARTGASKVILTESDSAWVDVVDDLKWMNGGKDFIWVSERDGWRHVYLASRSGGVPTLLTPGAYDVVNVAAVDEAGGWLYVMASPENATQRYLYRVSLKGGGAPQRVSPADAPGTHGYDVSPNAKWAFHTYSRTDVAPSTDLVALPAHTPVRALGRAGVVPSEPRLPTEFFHVTVADGATLDGWMIKPIDFDATKKYPVLVHVYGEPAAQTVVDRWGGTQDAWHRMLADRGYIVISVDTRGTPAPKGREWRKIIYGGIGTLSSKEEADAVRALTSARPYLDATRVAIWGWSGGGSSTLNAMFRYPDVYSVGMSVAPVADQRLYDTIYQERYVGLPQDNPKGYENGSPITYAAGLKGKLLVVHGEGDDNVHYQGTERLVNKLVELGKQFDMMVYPNRTHCICEGAGTTLHVYSLLTRYLLTNLPAGGR